MRLLLNWLNLIIAVIHFAFPNESCARGEFCIGEAICSDEKVYMTHFCIFNDHKIIIFTSHFFHNISSGIQFILLLFFLNYVILFK